MQKKLMKNTSNKLLSGVCSGIADYFKIDATLVRIIWALTVIFGFGSGIIIYIVFAFVMPKDEFY